MCSYSIQLDYASSILVMQVLSWPCPSRRLCNKPIFFLTDPDVPSNQMIKEASQRVTACVGGWASAWCPVIGDLIPLYRTSLIRSI